MASSPVPGEAGMLEWGLHCEVLVRMRRTALGSFQESWNGEALSMCFQIVSPDPKKARDKQQKPSRCLLISERYGLRTF